MTLFDSRLLSLFPYHRAQDKRASALTLDELLDDYRKAYRMSGAEFDFLMMAYRYEFVFQPFLKKFSAAGLRPAGLIDLLRLAFAALLTRSEENNAQLTHALVETSKKIFGPHTGGMTNAFCRRVLRERPALLLALEKNPLQILGPSLTGRWKKVPELAQRFALQVQKRPTAGIWALNSKGEFSQVTVKTLSEDHSLAMSEGSFAFVTWMTEQIAARRASTVKVLDMCAAPGGKIIALQQLLLKRGKSINAVAVDAKFKRIERLKENLATWKLEANVRPLLYDWTSSTEAAELFERWDVVVADLPCSGLGTLASRPDILLENWSESDEPLFKLQSTIVKRALELRTGKTEIYISICSSDPSEILHLSNVIGAEPTFRSQLSPTNNEEITAWRV